MGKILDFFFKRNKYKLDTARIDGLRKIVAADEAAPITKEQWEYLSKRVKGDGTKDEGPRTKDEGTISDPTRE